MTRDQIKERIENIIFDYIYTNGYGDDIIRGTNDAAEGIMKLWD